MTEARNPGNDLGVELARVELDHDLLRAGLELVDTPGVGSIHGHNTDAARAFLPRVDAAICVLDAGQPLSQAERELLFELSGRVPRLLIVINKIDHLEPDDVDAAVEFVRSALRDLLPDAEIELFAVSARRRYGLSRLVGRLRSLAADEREPLLLRSVARLARSVAADAAQAARFEARAIQFPLDQLGARAVTLSSGSRISGPPPRRPEICSTEVPSVRSSSRSTSRSGCTRSVRRNGCGRSSAATPTRSRRGRRASCPPSSSDGLT